jgi:hypothetical protein
MTFTTKLFAGTAGLAALAAATPATAQYYSSPYQANPYAYGSNPYAYGNPYANGSSSYGYNNGYAVNTNAAAQQCSAAVQSRLYNRSSLGGILGAVLGASTPAGRVVSVTQVQPRGNGMVRVRGLASSGRMASNGYGPYGVGAYGAMGYGYANQADLSFRCDVAPNGAVYSVSLNRRY